MKIIVIAGGQGTKMWPYSREDKPKQFQAIIGEQSPYAETIHTLLKVYAPEDIFISTKRKFIKYVSEQSPQIPLKNYIVEPDAVKDRGPGEGLAFLRLSVQHPNEPFFMVQSDCIRQPEEAFLTMIADVGKLVEQDKKLLTGGVKATEPNMGIDYFKLSSQVRGSGAQEVYEVAEFIYRSSSYRQTKELVENYRVVTHSNHYAWYPELMLEAYKKYRPDWYRALMKIKAAFDKPGEDAAIAKIYDSMEKGPTEEVTKHVFNSGNGRVVLLPFRWIDVGTWGSVYDYFVGGDGRENYDDGGKLVSVDTTGTLVKTDRPDKLIAVAGVEDLVIIDTEDVLLVIPKQKIEKIKDIQTILKDTNRTNYL